MRAWYAIVALLRALFRSTRIDDDLADEIRFHVEREAEANIARGMTPADARRAARLAFGSIDGAQEQSREERPGALARTMARDVHFGMRLLAKSPAFGITSVLIVALGIGAATAIFSVVHGVMFRPFPFPEPDRLVDVWLERGGAPNLPAAADAIALRDLRGVFRDVALYRNWNLNLVGESEPERIQSARVSTNLFTVLGVNAAMGRIFVGNEGQPGREHVVVLSDAFWRTRLAADPAVIGRQIQLDGAPHTVVGVMPENFQYPTSGHHAWVPLVVEPRERTREVTQNYRVVARLDPRVSIDQARHATAALATRLAETAPGNANTGIMLDSMLGVAIRDVRPALLLLLGAVSFLVVIACVNLATLFGARARTRASEFAVRLALGASRARLIAQAIAEAVPVLLLGGVLGVAVAYWAVELFVVTAPPGVPRTENIAISTPVVVFSLGLLAVVGLFVGIVPAIQAWRSDFTTMTKNGGRNSTPGKRRSSARTIGVAAQMAFTVPLLAGAGLLIRSAMNVAHVELGFDPDRVTTLQFEVSRAKHRTDAEVTDYYSRLIDAVRTVPGVATAALINRVPLGDQQTNTVQFENATGLAEAKVNVDSRTVTPDYFSTLGIRFIEGRGFTDRDDANAPQVVVADTRVARTMWPGESPIGKRLRDPTDRIATVIGVVDHVRTASLETDPLPQLYWNVRQWPQPRMVLVVRSATASNVSMPSVIKAMRSIDADQSVFNIRTMRDIVGRASAQRRMTTTLMAGFSTLALLLAAVGIYGVMAYGVAQRRREFGIRAALGATPSEVMRLVVSNGTAVAGIGAAMGLLLTLIAARAMSGLLYGITPRDATSIGGALLTLFAVATIASYLPARRAAAVDASITLRAE